MVCIPHYVKVQAAMWGLRWVCFDLMSAFVAHRRNNVTWSSLGHHLVSMGVGEVTDVSAQNYLGHVFILLFKRLVNRAVLHDGNEGQGAFEPTLPALHTPPGQSGQQLFSKPGGFGIHNAI